MPCILYLNSNCNSPFGKGSSGSLSFEAPIGFENNGINPPVADAGGPYSDNNEGVLINLDGTASSDPEGLQEFIGDVSIYAWDLNDDGLFDDPGVDARGPIVEVCLDDDEFAETGGEFDVNLLISDEAGNTDIDTATVSIANLAPVIIQITSTEFASDGLAFGDAHELGTILTINPTTFTDAGLLDTHDIDVLIENEGGPLNDHDATDGSYWDWDANRYQPSGGPIIDELVLATDSDSEANAGAGLALLPFSDANGGLLRHSEMVAVNGLFDVGETIYVDNDSDDFPSPGDFRLANFVQAQIFNEDTVVSEFHPDTFGNAPDLLSGTCVNPGQALNPVNQRCVPILVGFNEDEKYADTGLVADDFEVNEPGYLDDGDNVVSSVDTRLVNADQNGTFPAIDATFAGPFVDGSTPAAPNAGINAAEPTFNIASCAVNAVGTVDGISHTYSEAGIYTISLCVSDDELDQTCSTISGFIIGFDPFAGAVSADDSEFEVAEGTFKFTSIRGCT